VRCESVELELSARLDGAGDRRLDASVAAHLAGCAGCRAFEADSRRLRTLVRVREADPVPDLVPRIMERILGASDDAVRPIRPPRRVPSSRPSRDRRWLPYAASFLVGTLIAGVLLGGGLNGLRRGAPSALATGIPVAVEASITEVAAYRATFRIAERNFAPRVARRIFDAEIMFRAPERFRAVVTDLTRYPTDSWTRNDFSLSIDADRWLVDAPRTCPRLAQDACSAVGRDVRAVVGRAPFEGGTPLPTDIVLPVRTLVDLDRVEVVEETSVLDREAVIIALDYHDATPLFAYLQAAGTWRPLFPHDRVLVALDRESWFPLAYEVRAAGSVERAAWAVRQGLPEERPGSLLFRAEVTTMTPGPGPAWRPITRLPGTTRDHGFEDLDIVDIETRLGAPLPRPVSTAGLDPYRSGVSAGRFVVSYARGLGWLTITGMRPGEPTEPNLLVTPIRIGEGFGEYAPATSGHGRLLTLRDRGWELRLETNLPRADLVEVAASMPVVGIPPARPPQDLSDAERSVRSLLILDPPPDGYELWGVQAGRGDATLQYLRPGSELDGTGVSLYQSSRAGLPPPLDLEVVGVTVREMPGRYSAERAELEWVEGGVYRSLRAPAFDLAGLLRLAASLA
jgi:hypothetical protein